MMFEIIVLAIIQGLTEFLPISSSGHLVIAQHLMAMNSPGIVLEIFLHLATTASVLVYFRKDIIPCTKLWAKPILISFVITGMIGFLAKDNIESWFHNPMPVAYAFLIMGTILLISKNSHGEKTDIHWKHAVLFGIVQSIAITPGISRSGITLVVLMLMGIRRDYAFKFTFIASIPVILSAGALQILQAPSEMILNPSLVIAMTISFVVGILALTILKHWLNLNRLHLFGYYCIAAGVVLVAPNFIS